MRTPEFGAALEAWKKTEQEWEAFLESLSADEQEKAEDLKGGGREDGCALKAVQLSTWKQFTDIRRIQIAFRNKWIA